ncbi:MAG: alpha/beta hydrolase [Anaerolineae bacterium]
MIIDRTLRSRALLKPMRVRVYLPPGFSTDGLYPVIYLLHPWGADERYWDETLHLPQLADTLIDIGVIPPFVAVMPQGDKSYFINAANPQGDFDQLVSGSPDQFAGALEGCGDYGDYLLEDVIGWVEATFPVRTEPEGRVLAGIAMGGAGAGVLAFSRPRMFGTVAMHSPDLIVEPHFGPPWIFGLNDPLAFAARSPIALAENLSGTAGMRIALDHGCDDPYSQPGAALLHEALLDQGITHRFHVNAGTHSTGYWAAHLGEYIGYYTAAW